MERYIRIKIGNIALIARLNDSHTANEVWKLLPVSGEADRWGKEIYFEIPLELSPERDASDVVNRGDVAYWPPGKAFCMFWGPTPASRDQEIRAASPVNVFGRILWNSEALDDTKELEVSVERLPERERKRYARGQAGIL